MSFCVDTARKLCYAVRLDEFQLHIHPHALLFTIAIIPKGLKGM